MIVCMEDFQEDDVKQYLTHLGLERPVINLAIEDDFRYRDEHLMEAIAKNYIAKTGFGV